MLSLVSSLGPQTGWFHSALRCGFTVCPVLWIRFPGNIINAVLDVIITRSLEVTVTFNTRSERMTWFIFSTLAGSILIEMLIGFLSHALWILSHATGYRFA